MAQRLFGVEIEYGFAATNPSQPNQDQETLKVYALDFLLNVARETLVHLPGSANTGVFLENGSRFYLDCKHPEIANPEVDHPTECCRYVFANERTLSRLVEQIRLPQVPHAQFVLWKGNIDYTQQCITYGCHESYLHTCDPASLPRQLIPHLVSRVYLATGGLYPMIPGIRFCVFPRAGYFNKDISSSSTTMERGIYHTRDESHASSNFHRCHVICGDSTIHGLWLKTASTVAILALVEAGHDLGTAVFPRNAVASLHTFAGDPTFRATTPLADGRQATALDIQFHYLDFVERHLGHPNLPPWSEELCRVWRRTLELATKGPAAMARSMDWAIKLALFNTHMQRRGFAAESLGHYNHVLEAFRDTLIKKKSPAVFSPGTLDAQYVGPLADDVVPMRTYLADHGLRLDLLPDFLALRAELCEIDCRFSQLTPTPGICAQLAPHLQPLFPAPQDIERACNEPPATTRAGIRGRYIRRFNGRRRYSADWTEIRHANGRRLDLSHPFCKNVRWSRIPMEFPEESFSMIEGLFRMGRYADVLELLDFRMISSADTLETYVLACARMGWSRAAFVGLDRFQMVSQVRFDVIALTLCALVSLGLTPALKRMLPLIEEGDSHLASGGAAGEYHGLLYSQNKGRALAAAGRLDDAIALLKGELALPRSANRPRNRSRTQLYLAEALRLRGELEESRSLLNTALAAYRQENLRGDMADYVFPLSAKLTPDEHAARQVLDEAAQIQVEHRNELGLARVLCLKARRLGTNEDHARITELCQRVEALRTCPTTRRVNAEFDQWITADRSASVTMDYWGL